MKRKHLTWVKQLTWVYLTWVKHLCFTHVKYRNMKLFFFSKSCSGSAQHSKTKLYLEPPGTADLAPKLNLISLSLFTLKQIIS